MLRATICALIGAALMLLSCQKVTAQDRTERPQFEANVVYGTYSGLALLMDIRRPENPNGYAVLQIAGSGWETPLSWDAPMLKDGPQVETVANAFLAEGFTVFSINHRAAPRFQFPEPVLDAQRAARFIRQNAASFGVDPGWLGVFGGSSGGHLALMLSTLGEGSEGSLEPPELQSPKTECVIAVMAPSDLLPLGQSGWGVALGTQFIGTTAPFPGEQAQPGYQERLAPWLAASPIEYLDRAPENALLIHGDEDQLVPVDQSVQLAERLREAGTQTELRIMEGVGHNFANAYHAPAAEWMSDCLDQTR